MTIKEVYERIMLDVPKITHINFVKRYNEVIEMLSLKYDTANSKKTTIIDATNAEQAWYDLPSDCKGVTRVRNDRNEELRSYICDGKSINPGYVGSFNIEYIGTPAKITSMNTIHAMNTGIDEMFTLAIVHYILAYEVPDRFDFHYKMYLDIADKADARLSAVKRKHMRIKSGAFR